MYNRVKNSINHAKNDTQEFGFSVGFVPVRKDNDTDRIYVRNI